MKLLGILYAILTILDLSLVAMYSAQAMTNSLYWIVAGCWAFCTVINSWVAVNYIKMGWF